MESKQACATNVVRFPGARSAASPRRDQKSLMDAVYTAGSLPIAAEDRATKVMATRLSIFGFVTLDEVQADGTSRRLRPSPSILDRPGPAIAGGFGFIPGAPVPNRGRPAVQV